MYAPAECSEGYMRSSSKQKYPSKVQLPQICSKKLPTNFMYIPKPEMC